MHRPSPLKPPQLQTDWVNRPMFDLALPRPHVESFFLKAHDPKRRRALWLRVTLLSDGRETYGETWAVYFDPDAAGSAGRRYWVAKERFPLGRIKIDPERAGLGIDTCLLCEGYSAGTVRGDGFRIGWRLCLEDELPAYTPFPARWLYRGGLVSNKTVSPHPCARLSGQLELWHGIGRNAKVEVIDLAGWRAMQGHNWGRRHAERYAWTHCNAFDEAASGAFFEAFGAQGRIAGIRTPPLTLGRLVLEGRVYRFDTWRSLGAAMSDYRPMSWSFVLRGPDGELHGTTAAESASTVGLTYANPSGEQIYCLNSGLARMSLELTPRRGARRTLQSTRATLEIGWPETDHGIALAL